MNNKYNKEVSILREYIAKKLPTEEKKESTVSSRRQKILQYKEHIKQLKPVVYFKEQESQGRFS